MKLFLSVRLLISSVRYGPSNDQPSKSPAFMHRTPISWYTAPNGSLVTFNLSKKFYTCRSLNTLSGQRTAEFWKKTKPILTMGWWYHRCVCQWQLFEIDQCVCGHDVCENALWDPVEK